MKHSIGFGLLVLATTHCMAADGPSIKPTRFVVAFAPGVPDDLLARALSQELGRQTAKNYLVENRTGASGAIGFGYVAKSAPDGYTLGIVSTGWPATPLVNKAITYDPVKDFTPIMQTTRAPLVLVVPGSMKAANLKDFIALAKASPGKFNYGTAGLGSAIHLASELFNKHAGIQLSHIPFKGGSSEIMSAVMSGEVQMLLTQAPPVLPQIRSGKLLAVTVTAEAGKRLANLPEVPTLSEAGLPGLVIYNWGGIVGPAGMATDMTNRIHADLHKALFAPAVKDPFIAQGTEFVGNRPEEFSAYVKSEVQRWEDLIKSTGIKFE